MDTESEEETLLEEIENGLEEIKINETQESNMFSSIESKQQGMQQTLSRMNTAQVQQNKSISAIVARYTTVGRTLGRLQTARKDKEVHSHVRCDGCGMNPIIGSRWKCATCPNFDYCQQCHDSKSHSSHHFRAKPIELHPRTRCDGCQMCPIIGARWKCVTCPDFDLCDRCNKKTGHEHMVQDLDAGFQYRVVISCSGCQVSASYWSIWRVAGKYYCDHCYRTSHLDGAQHWSWSCNGYGSYPTEGKRWKCDTCPDFDFCEMCYRTKTETHFKHRFNQITLA